MSTLKATVSFCELNLFFIIKLIAIIIIIIIPAYGNAFLHLMSNSIIVCLFYSVSIPLKPGNSN